VARKDSVIVIKCRREVMVAFKRFAAEYDTYEDALLDLLKCKGIYVQEKYAPL
jgi:hypothetical protein